MNKGGAVYIICNQHKNVLYVGATIDLRRRIIEHREKFYSNSFSDRYNCDKLIYYELFDSTEEAFARERQIKKYRREKKEALIDSMNPEWRDLFEDIKNG
jgi:putative endonuclease